jgi:UDP-GlcNAc:undecaprenyl-phosphate GlcNAc-1-phosphate transferase
MELLYSFAVALFLTIGLMPVAMRLAPALGLLDRPDAGRKQHARVIPRCGGVAMAFGIAVPLLAFFSQSELLQERLYWSLGIGCALIVLFGVLDDRADLHYRWKFAGQIAATIIAINGGFVIHHVPLMGLDQAPAWLSLTLSFFFILGVTNAVNLTDGLDGLAGGTSLLTLAAIVAIALLTHNAPVALIAITVIGGILGFLRFNTYPAQVFMGDAGSQLLGFAAACLALHVTQAESAPISPVLPLLLLGLPVLDTLTVMTIRLREGRSPFSPDRNHLHHQMIAIGFRHNEAVAIIYVLQVVLLSIAFLWRYASDLLLLSIYAAFCASLLGSLHFARRRGWQFHVTRPAQAFVDRRNILLRRMQWFYEHSVIVMQLLLAGALLIPLLPHAGQPTPSLGLLLAAALIALPLMLMRRHASWIVRLTVYPASVWAAHLIGSDPALREYLPWIHGYFGLIALVLALAIRMTRHEHFRLDTQDLLVLVLIVTVPLLPFEWIREFAAGETVLRIAVLMYGCEFILGRMQGRSGLPLSGVAGFSMLYTFFSL